MHLSGVSRRETERYWGSYCRSPLSFSVVILGYYIHCLTIPKYSVSERHFMSCICKIYKDISLFLLEKLVLVLRIVLRHMS